MGNCCEKDNFSFEKSTYQKYISFINAFEYNLLYKIDEVNYISKYKISDCHLYSSNTNNLDLSSTLKGGFRSDSQLNARLMAAEYALQKIIINKRLIIPVENLTLEYIKNYMQTNVNSTTNTAQSGPE